MTDSKERSERKAVGLLVKLKHEDVGSFAEEFATNLSPGGMFIRSRQPQPKGTRIRFEIQIAGGVRVMRGSAVVRWTRQAGDPAGPAGMGLQFEDLDEPTRQLIARMLQQSEAAAVEAEKPAPPSAKAPAEAAAPPPPPAAVAPPPAPRAGPSPLASLFDGLEEAETPAPVHLAAVPPAVPEEEDEPLGAAPPPPPMEAAPPPPPPSANDVDVWLSELVASSPAPVPPSTSEKEANRAIPSVAVDLELPDAGEEPLDILPEEPKPAPPPPAARKAPPPSPPAPTPTLSPATLQPAATATPAAPAANGKPVFLKPPATLPSTGPVIGIDLGTTNSCVAILSGGRPSVLRAKDGYNTIPSVVSLTAAGKLLVSHRAKNQRMLNPTQTIYGAKRLVGRPYDSATVRQVRERFHYAIVPDAAGKAAVQLGGNVLSLEEVQGIILRECKEMAEQHLQQNVGRAVVTVPAYYSEPQREAVRKAGALAGLKVERILNEPTAAALAYGLNRELSKRILVYDLGGGTFDATVLRIEKNVFEVLATGGDTFLGGVDFDNTVVDFLLEHFQKQEKLTFTGDDVALSRVSDAAERAKMALSERSSFEVHIPMLMMDDAGKPRDLRCTMTRQELDQICDVMVKRTLDVVRDVLLDAKLKPSDVDEIILVGGQSRMPLVRDRLKQYFGRNAHASVNADEAVALGAALYSGSVDKVSSVVLIDVLPMTIGVGMPGGAFKRVIERNSPLPAQKSFALSTSKDNEEVLEISVFQGEDNHIAANEYLGTVRLEGLPKGKKGDVKVAVTLKLDQECVLKVEARELSTRKEVNATLATRYTPEQLQKQLKITGESAAAAEQRRGKDLNERAGRFWGFLKKVIGK